MTHACSCLLGLLAPHASINCEMSGISTQHAADEAERQLQKDKSLWWTAHNAESGRFMRAENRPGGQLCAAAKLHK